MIGLSTTTQTIKLAGQMDFSKLWETSTLIFLALLGWESLSFGAKEIRHVEKTLPRIYLLSYLVIVSIYLILALVVAGVVTTGRTINGSSGLLPLIQSLPFGNALVIGTIFIVLGNVVSSVYSGSRMLYYASESKTFSPAFSKLNKNQVPHLGLLYLFLLCSLVLFTQLRWGATLSALVQMTNKSLLIIYLLCLVNYCRRDKGVRKYLISGTAAASSAFLFSSFDWSFLYPVALLAVGFLISPTPISQPDKTVVTI
jgi:amino acid transporter